MAATGHLSANLQVTIWWKPRNPNVIKICTGDRRFVNDNGGRPGLWISVRRDNPNLWNRLARALAAAGQLAPALVS